MTDLMPFPRAGFRPLLKRIAADDAGVEAADVSGAALGPDFAAALAAALRGNTHVTRVDARGAGGGGGLGCGQRGYLPNP